MNTEQFIQALGQIGEGYVEEAMAAPKGRLLGLKRLELAACACLVLLLGALIGYGLVPMGEAPELPTVVVMPSTEESEEPNSSATEPITTEPITTEPITTESITTEPITTESSQATEPSSHTEPIPSTQPPTTIQSPSEPPVTESIEIPPALPSYPPMLFVNGMLYELLPGEAENPDTVAELPFIGTVGSCCSEEELPDTHLEANEPIIGAEVYVQGEHLLVLVSGYLRIYVRSTVQ